MLIAGVKLETLDASPVNPAIATMLIIFNTSAKNWATSWIFMFTSLIGSVLSLVFFEFVYKKTQQAMEDIEDEEEHNSEALLED